MASVSGGGGGGLQKGGPLPLVRYRDGGRLNDEKKGGGVPRGKVQAAREDSSPTGSCARYLCLYWNG